MFCQIENVSEVFMIKIAKLVNRYAIQWCGQFLLAVWKSPIRNRGVGT